VPTKHVRTVPKEIIIEKRKIFVLMGDIGFNTKC
jgi:hypothetical protein